MMSELKLAPPKKINEALLANRHCGVMPSGPRIIYPSEKYLSSFHAGLSLVAQEKIYIEMIEAPPFEKVAAFQRELLESNGPVYYAIDGDRVVGWCDIFPLKNERQKHRGTLGMGLLPDYRGKGLGAKLLSATLDHAQKIGLEKVELHVYTSNVSAIALYKKFGFQQEGVIKKYRKLDGVDFDCVAMALFL